MRDDRCILKIKLKSELKIVKTIHMGCVLCYNISEELKLQRKTAYTGCFNKYYMFLSI